MKKLLNLILVMVCVTPAWAQFDAVRTSAERMPLFMECLDVEDADEQRQCSNQMLVNELANYLNYPDAARVARVEGTVYVSFVVDQQGNITQPKILRDIGYGCGVATLAALQKLPRLKPANDRGADVSVEMRLPVVFSLEQADRDRAEDYRISWGNTLTNQLTTEQLRGLLSKEILVRDMHGNQMLVDELAFSFERNEKILEARSRGNIDAELRAVAEKARRGGVLTVYAAVQDGGEFVYLTREFAIVD